MKENIKALSFRDKIKYQTSLARKNYDCYLFLAPFGILFILFTVLPVVISIFYGFTNYNLLEAPDFIGLKNFQKLFVNDSIFTKSFRNTMIVAVIVGPIGYLASFMIAWQINELSNVMRPIMITIMYAPSISGGAIIIWQYIFSNDSYGYINSVLTNFGFIQQPVQFLSDTKFMLMIVIVVMIWQSLGAGFLSFAAGLRTVEKSFYEAAYVDGITSRWQELWFITLPTMRPQLMFGAVMSITSAFSAGAVSTQMFGNPSTDYAAHTIMNHLEDYGGVRFELGYACTIATVLFAMMIIINEVVQRLLNKVGS